jgi:hypothetical protein
LIEATGISVPIGNSEILLAAVYKRPGEPWSDADILLNLRNKSLLAGDLKLRTLFGAVKFQIFQMRNF